MQQKTELGLYESKKYSWNVNISFEVKSKGYSYQTKFYTFTFTWEGSIFTFYF